MQSLQVQTTVGPLQEYTNDLNKKKKTADYSQITEMNLQSLLKFCPTTRQSDKNEQGTLLENILNENESGWK